MLGFTIITSDIKYDFSLNEVPISDITKLEADIKSTQFTKLSDTHYMRIMTRKLMKLPNITKLI